MANAERGRRLAESAAKGGSGLAPGHELLFNRAFVFDPMLLREVLDRPGTLFAWNGVPVVGQIEKGGDPMAGAAPDPSDGRKLYNRQLRKLEQPFEIGRASCREKRVAGRVNLCGRRNL